MGRGRSLGGGRGLGGSPGGNVNVQSQLDVWSYRHNPNNEPFVDQINESVRQMEGDFPGLMSEVSAVNAATLGGADAETVLGFYSTGDRSVNMNTNYTDPNKMNMVYDDSVKSGFHPPRGDKTGTQAVTYHETGHALTGVLADRMGISDFDQASKQIVDNAYRTSGGKGGTHKWAGGISGYAQESNAECIAEACADWYCNGGKAKPQSKAIMAEMRRIYNGG